MNEDLASILRPVAAPRVFDDAYTEDQYRRLIGVVRENGPWQMIIAQHFNSAEELIATMSGSMPEGVTPTFDMFLTPTFRGYLAQNGACLYPELEDCFFNGSFLDRVRSYWNAKYAKPEQLLFNIQGPSASYDTAHVDGTSFRGITNSNTPIWLLNTMAKSGLFQHWLNKKAQVIAWFYQGSIGHGFTYWPDGPLAQPKRLAMPMWGRAVVVQNEMMYHRGEAGGPAEMRLPQGLAFESLFGADPESRDGWQITTGGKVIQKVPASETRFLVHWGAEIYADYDELKKVMDHTDDLTHERVFDTFIADLRARGHSFDVPSDPLRDREFIKLLTRVYDLGRPRIYPVEAPGPHQPQLGNDTAPPARGQAQVA
jgi:hypothetical protein